MNACLYLEVVQMKRHLEDIGTEDNSSSSVDWAALQTFLHFYHDDRSNVCFSRDHFRVKAQLKQVSQPLKQHISRDSRPRLFDQRQTEWITIIPGHLSVSARIQEKKSWFETCTTSSTLIFTRMKSCRKQLTRRIWWRHVDILKVPMRFS